VLFVGLSTLLHYFPGPDCAHAFDLVGEGIDLYHPLRRHLAQSQVYELFGNAALWGPDLLMALPGIFLCFS
jgi:hypothetical protein